MQSRKSFGHRFTHVSHDESTIVLRSGKDLVKKLLIVDPTKRLTVIDALKHEWIVGEVSNTPLEGARKNMRNQDALKLFKKAGAAVLAINKLKKERDDLLKSVEEEDEDDIEIAEEKERVALERANKVQNGGH